MRMMTFCHFRSQKVYKEAPNITDIFSNCNPLAALQTLQPFLALQTHLTCSLVSQPLSPLPPLFLRSPHLQLLLATSPPATATPLPSNAATLSPRPIPQPRLACLAPWASSSKISRFLSASLVLPSPSSAWVVLAAVLTRFAARTTVTATSSPSVAFLLPCK